MKITDLQIDGFGVWKGLTVDKITNNITVFYGQNEAGKTTLMQFIRSMLFGFSADRREKYVPPVYGGLAGGSAFVTAPQGMFEIQRHVDPNRHADAQGDLTLVDNKSGDVHGNATLATMMANIDESIFNNVFAVGLREIQELGALNNTQAADHLYRLTSGLDRVSLVDVMRDLVKRREGLWATDPKVESQIAKLQTRRQQLIREVEEQRAKSKRWSRIAAMAKEASVRLEELKAELSRVEREARLVELSIQISDRWNARDVITKQIEAFGTLPDLRDISVATLDQLNSKITKQKERINQIKSERKRIRNQGEELGVNKGLLELRTKAEALQAHAPWIESLERQAQQYKSEIEKIESTVNGEIDGLGSQIKLKNRDLADLASRGISSLKTVAKNLTEQQKRLLRLKDEADKSKFELGQNEQHLGESLAETTGSIPESLDDTSRQVNRLRRRIELDEKIDKLQKSRSELEMDIDNVVEDQVLPVGKLSVIGMVFIGGVMFMGFGILSSGIAGNWYAIQRFSNITESMGLVMMIMGLVCGFVSLGLKYHWERIARDSMDDFRHQMELVKNQLKRARSERDELDRLLPANAGQFQIDLQDAETKLSRLESLVPLENRAKSTRMKLDDLRRQITNQEREVEECEKRWQSSLRALGLPDSLTPNQVREISVRSGRIAQFSTRLELCKSELAIRDKELQQVSSRVAELLSLAGIKVDASLKSPLLALSKLNNLINDQRQLLTSRQELRGQYTHLRAQLEKMRRELDRLLGQRRRLLSVVGVDNEEEYRQFNLKHSQREKLIEKQNQLTEQISAGLGKGLTEDDVRPLLTSFGKSGLEKRWEQLLSEVDRLKVETTQLLQQRGERLQEIKILGEDSKLDQVRLELNTIEAELKIRFDEWQTVATSSLMLETIREGYESKRQPETLKEASVYLEKLTDGHYRRIWTRLVGEELLVDNHDGETITVDKLSRGTREAVYLSLRLALVTVYARRGAVLPLVFDDILVNFDANRMRTAAKLLSDFSKNGYQILMFTCHDHMRDLFHSLEADVRILPNHRDVVEHGATTTHYQPKPRKDIETPVPAVATIVPVGVPALAKLQLEADGFDPDLEYELSAVTADQNKHIRLGTSLVYVDDRENEQIDLAGIEEVWDDRSSRQTA